MNMCDSRGRCVFSRMVVVLIEWYEVVVRACRAREARIVLGLPFAILPINFIAWAYFDAYLQVWLWYWLGWCDRLTLLVNHGGNLRVSFSILRLKTCTCQYRFLLLNHFLVLFEVAAVEIDAEMCGHSSERFTNSESNLLGEKFPRTSKDKMHAYLIFLILFVKVYDNYRPPAQ